MALPATPSQVPELEGKVNNLKLQRETVVKTARTEPKKKSIVIHKN